MDCSDSIVDQWSAVIGVATHFNELLLSTRTLLASVILAVVGAAAISITQIKGSDGFVGPFHVGVWIAIAGMVLLGCVFMLDHFYYFELLRGAVDVAQKMEERCYDLPNLTIELFNRVPSDRAYKIVYFFYGTILSALLAATFLVWRISLKQPSSSSPNH